jgi:hypothetical protein
MLLLLPPFAVINDGTGPSESGVQFLAGYFGTIASLCFSSYDWHGNEPAL